MAFSFHGEALLSLRNTDFKHEEVAITEGRQTPQQIRRAKFSGLGGRSSLSDIWCCRG